MISSSSCDQVTLIYFTFVSISTSPMNDEKGIITITRESERVTFQRYIKDSGECNVPSDGLLLCI